MNTNHGATSLKDFDETDVAGDVTAQLDTLKAENARLKAIERAAAALIRSHLYADSADEQAACMAELFRVMEAQS